MTPPLAPCTARQAWLASAALFAFVAVTGGLALRTLWTALDASQPLPAYDPGDDTVPPADTDTGPDEDPCANTDPIRGGPC